MEITGPLQFCNPPPIGKGCGLLLPSGMNLRFAQAFVMLAGVVNPYPPNPHFHNLDFAYHQLERYQEAIAKAKRVSV